MKTTKCISMILLLVVISSAQNSKAKLYFTTGVGYNGVGSKFHSLSHVFNDITGEVIVLKPNKEFDIKETLFAGIDLQFYKNIYIGLHYSELDMSIETFKGFSTHRLTGFSLKPVFKYEITILKNLNCFLSSGPKFYFARLQEKNIIKVHDYIDGKWIDQDVGSFKRTSELHNSVFLESEVSLNLKLFDFLFVQSTVGYAIGKKVSYFLDETYVEYSRWANSTSKFIEASSKIKTNGNQLKYSIEFQYLLNLY